MIICYNKSLDEYEAGSRSVVVAQFYDVRSFSHKQVLTIAVNQSGPLTNWVYLPRILASVLG